LTAHIESPAGAHPASAISVLDPFDRFTLGEDVETSLDELAALIPPAMGGVGSSGVAWLGSANSGAPDWGILKLNDGALAPTLNPVADVAAVYPYYYRAPVSETGTGVDIAKDPMFNVADGGYDGGGVGLAHAAFVTVTQGLGAADGYPTWRLFKSIANPSAVVSGICSPADRGVLALVKWPYGEPATPAAPAANIADIQARCIAAILLGKGLQDGADGLPGGIFSEASGSQRAFGSLTNVANPAAPYTITIGLPGGLTSAIFTATAGAPTNPLEFQVGGGVAATATNLSLAINSLYYPNTFFAIPVAGVVELHLASPGTIGNSVTFADSSATYVLVAPTGGTDVVSSPYNFPGRAAGQYMLDELQSGVSVTAGTNPFTLVAAGQVRLLTDPSAVTFAPAVTNGGLPVFGGTANSIGTTVVPSLPSSIGIGGGTNGNFFAYRLPYLKDYSTVSNLPYTPTVEKARFTDKLLPALGGAGTLAQAGNYANFTADFWSYQLARYRHRFSLAVGAVADRRDDNYALVHFKKEAYFESYVRDGVVPSASQVYSTNLVDWTGNSSPFDQLDNLIDPAATATVAAPYGAHRSEILEDNDGTAVPAPVTTTYTLGIGANNLIYYSGVQYYTPLDRVADTAAASIQVMTLDFTGAFKNNGYRSHDKVPVAGPLAADQRRFALNQNLGFLSLSSFAYEGTESPVASNIVSTSAAVTLFPGRLGEFRRQRVEFGFADLFAGATNPVTASHLSYTFNVATLPEGFNFFGDTTTPSFTQDAKVRFFIRRPLVVDGATGFSMPYVGGNTASNRGFTLTEASGKPILFHSMQEGSFTAIVPYGNASVFGSATAAMGPIKDTQERFLDEVYRYPEDWAPLVGGVGTPQAILQGPGISGAPGTIGAINVLVRPVQADPNWPGWYFQSLHMAPLSNIAPYDKEAQVAGLPARNPNYSEGVENPFPSRGLLIYPQKDYTGYLPVGPNYTGLTGERVFVRALNAGPVTSPATTTASLRIHGLQYADLTGTPPGGAGIAVMVKVPGLTTWMDVGEENGAGPAGKQDAAFDGAGCHEAHTDGTELSSQTVYCDVILNLGFGLFDNGAGMCPLLVKVILKDNATSKGLNFEQGGEDGVTTSCRGLIGIDIL